MLIFPATDGLSYFFSDADNLVKGDTNGVRDVFLHDLQTGETTRISVGMFGLEANGPSSIASISGDGRYVAFESEANNLVVGDTNDVEDIFVHDLQTGEIIRVSVLSGGAQRNSASEFPSISADGRFVAFHTPSQILVHNRMLIETTMVSVSSDGTPGDEVSRYPVISGDGRFVAFESRAENLVSNDLKDYDDVFLHDRLTRETTLISVPFDGNLGKPFSGLPSISANGRYISYSIFINGVKRVFVHDRLTHEITEGTIASDGTPANNASDMSGLSADGRYLVFDSAASNLTGDDTDGLIDIFVHDLGAD